MDISPELAAQIEALAGQHNLSVEDYLRRRLFPAQEPDGDSLLYFFNISRDMLSISQNGVNLHLNQAWVDTLGYDDDTLKTLSPLELVHPDDREATIKIAAQLRREGILTHFENRYRHADGSYRWISWTASTDESGKFYASGRDITTQKQVEQELRENNILLQTIFDHLPLMITVSSSEPRILKTNRALEKTFGWTEAELRDNPRLMLSLFRTPEELQAMLEYIRTTHYTWGEFVMKLRDGQLIDVAVMNIPLPDGRILGIRQDISEKKKIERELIAQNEVLQTIFENIPVMISFFDEAGKFITVNRAWQETLMWSKEAALAHPDLLSEFYPEPEYRQQAIEHMLEAEPGWRDFYMHLPDGRIIDTSWANVKLKDGRTIGIGQDVTEKKKIERELQRQNELLQTVFDNIPVMIAFFDEHGKFVTVNRAWETTLLWSKKDTIVHPDIMTEFYPDPEYRQQAIGYMLSAEPDWRDFRTHIRDGRIIDTSWANVKLQDGRSIGIGQDISERKTAERHQRQLVKELETRNAEMERFTYTVSHDLKSPLITILGFVSLLKKDIESGDMERVEKDFNFIREAATRMQDLLDNLLELSRIGRIINPPESVSLLDLTRQAVMMLHTSITERGIEVHIDPALPVVYADPVRLREVMQNLIENAVKFMGDQPHPRIDITVRPHNVIVVRDNGIGIDPRYTKKIFGLFEKLDADGAGTGIGLTLVKRIIEYHGGEIWIESGGLGQGSAFCFTLENKNS